MKPGPMNGISHASDRRRSAATLAAVSLLAVSAAAGAQTLVSPSVSLSETYTTNRNLLSVDPQSDFITRVSPRVSVSSRGGAVQGNLDYTMVGLLYARGTYLNEIQHNLASNARISLLEGRVGMLASASAARQAISAYGLQTPDPALGDRNNQTQTFNYSLAPYLSGVLLGEVNYHARLSYTASRTDSSFAGDTASGTALLSLSKQFGALGLGLEGSRTIMDSKDRERSHNGRVFASASHRVNSELAFVVRAGTESDDLVTSTSRQRSTWGLGTTWSPTPRTMVQLDYDRRFFGDAHSISLSHRMANTVWTYSDVRSLEMGETGGRSLVSAYDLFFAQAASIEPDPIKRDQLVRAVMLANGLDLGSTVVVGGFLTGGPTVQRAQQFAVAYRGLRATVVLTLSRTQTDRIGNGLAVGDLAQMDRIRQQGGTLSWSHRLAPETSFILTAGLQHTDARGSEPSNELRSLVASWSERLGPRSSLTVSVRHSDFESVTNPYRESALIGTFNLQF